MLKKLYVDNFRCLVNFELKLDPLTLLYGPNGSGKSSVFEVLYRLRQFISGESKVNQLFPTSDLTRWQGRPLQTFNMELEGENGTYAYDLVIEHNIEKRLIRVNKEILSFNRKPLYEFVDGTAQLYHDDHETGPKYPFDWSQSGIASLQPRSDNKRLTSFKNMVSKIIIAGINPLSFKGETENEEETPSRSMSNFASWFRYLSQEHQGCIVELTNELRNIMDGFDSFKLTQAGENYRILQVRYMADGISIDYKFDELSDGQKVMIVLYTLLFSVRELDYSIFLDEPENFLALPEIQPWLMALEDASYKDISQVVLISHHPEFIDYLGKSSGISFERAANGPVRIKDKIDTGESGLKLSEVIERGWDK